MSDYLDNLLTRNTTTQEGVRPRPVSLFEPLPGMPRAPADPARGLEATEEEPAGDTRAPGPQERGRPAVERLPAPEPNNKLHSPRSPAAPQPSRVRAVPPPTAQATGSADNAPSGRPASPRRTPAPTARADRTARERPSLRAAPIPAPQPAGAEGAQAAAAVRPPIGETQHSERTAQETHPVRAPLLERTVIERIVPGAPQPPRPEAQTRLEPDRESSAAAPDTLPRAAVPPVVPVEVVARPQIRLAPAPTPAPAAAGAGAGAGTATPEPTIQVTIGRIEVRATQAPTPARRSAPRAQPALSLEEYLRQRRGGA